MAYALPFSGQQTALTYGRRRKQPTYVSDIITAEASQLPALYALKQREEREKEAQALERQGIESAEAIAAKEREQAEALATRQRESQELIASRQQELEDLMSRRAISSQEMIASEQQALAAREAEISKILGFGGFALNLSQVSKDLLGADWTPEWYELGGAGLGAAAGYALTRKRPKYQQALASAGGAALGYYAKDIGGLFGSIAGSVAGLFEPDEIFGTVFEMM